MRRDSLLRKSTDLMRLCQLVEGIKELKGKTPWILWLGAIKFMANVTEIIKYSSIHNLHEILFKEVY